jgi:hypothetical protein
MEILRLRETTVTRREIVLEYSRAASDWAANSQSMGEEGPPVRKKPADRKTKQIHPGQRPEPPVPPLSPLKRATQGLAAIVLTVFGTIPFPTIVKVAFWCGAALIFVRLIGDWASNTKQIIPKQGLIASFLSLFIAIALLWLPVKNELWPISLDESYIDVRPSGSPNNPYKTIVNFTYRGPGKTKDFCFWVYPLFPGDPGSISLGVPQGYTFPERLEFYSGETEPSTPMSTFAQIDRGTVPAGPVVKIYTYNSYKDQQGQRTEEEHVFSANGDTFIPDSLDNLTQHDGLRRYATTVCAG